MATVQRAAGNVFIGRSADFTALSNQVLANGPGTRFVISNPAAPGDPNEYTAVLNNAVPRVPAWIITGTQP